MKCFDITYFGHIPFDYFTREDIVADIAASGMTLCQLLDTTIESSRKILPLLKKYGMNACIMEKRIRDIYLAKDERHVDAVVKSVVDDYSEFDNITGFEICDEPTTEDFPIIAQITEAFHKYAPDKETVVNLFPNYAKPIQLKDTDYLSHIENFVQIVKPDFLSYDHYHFIKEEEMEISVVSTDISERERLIREGGQTHEKRDEFFVNMEQIRQTGLANNLEQMLIVLLTEHGCYRNLTKEEILWEVNMCLAYGMHRISYFTYWLPSSGDDFWHWKNAMCDRNGNKLPHYYDVQDINKNILEIGNMLFETTSKAVFHIKTSEKGGVEFAGFDYIDSIDGNRGVVGFFEDDSMYLVNHNFEKEGTFTIHANKMLSVYTGETFIPVGKTYTITLKPGAGILLK